MVDNGNYKEEVVNGKKIKYVNIWTPNYKIIWIVFVVGKYYR
jgi:hypothetical protein